MVLFPNREVVEEGVGITDATGTGAAAADSVDFAMLPKSDPIGFAGDDAVADTIGVGAAGFVTEKPEALVVGGAVVAAITDGSVGFEALMPNDGTVVEELAPTPN